MAVNQTAGRPQYASPVSSHNHTLHFSWTRGPHSGDLFPSLPPSYMGPQDSVLATAMMGWRVRREEPPWAFLVPLPAGRSQTSRTGT